MSSVWRIDVRQVGRFKFMVKTHGGGYGANPFFFSIKVGDRSYISPDDRLLEILKTRGKSQSDWLLGKIFSLVRICKKDGAPKTWSKPPRNKRKRSRSKKIRSCSF